MFLAALALLAPPAFEVRERIPLPGGEAWGRPTFDKPSHRLFIPREGHVQVVDVKTGKLVGDVGGLTGARDVVLVPERDLAFASDAKANEVLVFDRTNGAEVKRIPVADGPDRLAFDPRTKRVLVTTNQDLVPIDAYALTAKPRVALGGTPSDVVVADRGTAFVAVGDAIERLDLGKGRVADRWAVSADALAYDPRRDYLYALSGGSLTVLDAKHRTIHSVVPLEGIPRTVLSDFELGLAFAVAEDGTLTVVHAKTAAVVQTLATAPGATSAAIDPDDHRLYLLAREGNAVNVLVVARVRNA